MFPMEYKREMDALAPSEAAMARLEALTKGESLEKPGRRLGRRAAAALALCAALAVTAVAAGPSVWSALAEHLGPFGAWVAPISCSSTSAGVELEAVGVLSDGVTARFYLTAHDRVGGRLDGHTDVNFDLDGALSWGASALAFDEESDTLLLELEASGLAEGEALTLSGGSVEDAARRLGISRATLYRKIKRCGIDVKSMR